MKGKLKGKKIMLIDYQMAKEKQSILDIRYPTFKDIRIDCLYVNRYYKIDDTNQIYLRIFNPTLAGIEKLKELKQVNQMKGQKTMTSLKEKLNQAKVSNPKKNLNVSKLQDKLNQAKQKKTFTEKNDLTIDKFIAIEKLEKTIFDQSQIIKDQNVILQDCVNSIAALHKVTIENNSLNAAIAKDQRSCLNAINSMNSILDTIKNPIVQAFSKVSIPANSAKEEKHILRKKEKNETSTSKSQSLQSQNLSDENYQALYEHFKTYFDHKFCKSNECNKLSEFKFFINGIDFTNHDSINKSARDIWQAYRSENKSMIFAPGSMQLAIDSLIKLASDFDLINKNDIVNSELPSEVKDFKYWGSLFDCDIAIIKEAVSLIKSEGLNETTSELIKDHIIENSESDNINDNDMDEFISYLDETDFA